MVRVCKDCGTVFEKGISCPKCASINSDIPKWINKVSVKDVFVDDPTDQNVLNCCNKLIPQLEKVFENNQNIMSEDVYSSLDECIEAFKDIKSYIDKGLSYVGDDRDYADEFNHWLEELYELGDLVMNENVDYFQQQHFLWIG